MLVLSRKQSQEIAIDGDIRVTILSITGNQVRLGITAPIGVRVDRKELRDRIEAEARIDTPHLVGGLEEALAGAAG